MPQREHVMAKKKATKKKVAKKTTRKKAPAKKPLQNKEKSARAMQRAKAKEPGGKSRKAKLTPIQQKIIANFKLTGILTDACEAAGTGRSTHYRAMENPDYAEAFHEAEQHAADMVEREALRRAVEGVEEPVFYQGQECGHVRKYSDNLLVKILAARKPKQYGTNRTEVTGKDGGAIQQQSNVKMLTEEDLAKMPNDMLEQIAAQVEDKD